MKTQRSCWLRLWGLVLCLLLSASVGLAAFCQECGAKLPERAKFCPQCGVRLQAAAASGTEGHGTATRPRLPAPERTEAPRPRLPERPSVAGERPAPAGTGLIKVGSTPIDCVVTFRGNGYEKTRALMLFRDVPAGRYTIGFSRGRRRIEKVVDVQPGKETFVFGNLQRASAPAAAPRPAPTPPPSPAYVEEKAPLPSTSFQGETIQDADDKFRLAETLRKSVNPFVKKGRYEEAKRLYEEILERWPKSDKIEGSHYELGQIYESVYYRDYYKAINKYKEVLRLNTDTTYDVCWRIAVLYDNRIGDKTKAREWYELAAQRSKSDAVRRKAEATATELRKQGF